MKAIFRLKIFYRIFFTFSLIALGYFTLLFLLSSIETFHSSGYFSAEPTSCRLTEKSSACYRQCLQLSSNRSSCFGQCDVANVSVSPCDALDLRFIPIFSSLETKKKVISFSLFGDPKYQWNLERVIRRAQHVYPEWILRFYISKDIPSKIINLLISSNSEVILVLTDPPEGLFHSDYHGMFWRFFVADDFQVHRYLIRDADSYFIQRERYAVYDWIKKGNMFHIMRDHENHNTNILGGMWGGIVNTSVLHIKSLYDHGIDFRKLDGRQKDQDFLRKYVWPIVKRNVTCHASVRFFLIADGDCHDFPTQRVGHEYVGNSDAVYS